MKILSAKKTIDGDYEIVLGNGVIARCPDVKITGKKWNQTITAIGQIWYPEDKRYKKNENGTIENKTIQELLG